MDNIANWCKVIVNKTWHWFTPTIEDSRFSYKAEQYVLALWIKWSLRSTYKKYRKRFMIGISKTAIRFNSIKKRGKPIKKQSTIMISKDIQELIPQIQLFMGSQPIKRAWLYGSCSRGEETSQSDIDILVEYDSRVAKLSLMKISGIMLQLEKLLCRRIDMVGADDILPFAKKNADKDKILIYERSN